MRDTIIEILEDLKPGVDFENETAIISGGILPSIKIVKLVNDLNDEFDITISADKLIPENFESVDAIERLVKELLDE